jgi:hypothetical protein
MMLYCGNPITHVSTIVIGTRASTMMMMLMERLHKVMTQLCTNNADIKAAIDGNTMVQLKKE